MKNYLRWVNLGVIDFNVFKSFADKQVSSFLCKLIFVAVLNMFSAVINSCD